jgi:hypothetical protein
MALVKTKAIIFIACSTKRGYTTEGRSEMIYKNSISAIHFSFVEIFLTAKTGCYL